MALNGNTNEEKIWNYLKSKGLNDFGCAGLMGNIQAESGLNPKNLQNTYENKLGYSDEEYCIAVDNGTYTNFVKDSAGWGICQWTYWSRKQNLFNYAKSVGKSIGDLEMQLDFLWKELNEGYTTSVLSVLKSATSILQASNAVLLKYERPADQSEAVQTKRASFGQTYYDKYAGTSSNKDTSTNKDGKYVKGVSTRLSTNFTSNEFDCHGSGCCSETLVDAKLIEYLQKIRNHFGVAVSINSGYRCEKHNAAVGGASQSKHKYGQAADIVVQGVAPLKVAQYAESLGILGIGQYSNFVHIDTRTTKYYWYGSNEEYRSTFGKYVNETKIEAKEDTEVDSGDVNKGGNVTMKYNANNKPLVCMQTNSTCYKGTRTMTVLGVLWHSTGANNPNLKRYVQPSDTKPSADNYSKEKWLEILGKNSYGNDWNHTSVQAGLNCWIGKLADGTVTTVQTMPWNYRPWGCGSGSKGSCNNGWIQFEICEDGLTDKNYFEKVYKEACEITAYLCNMYNLDPNGTQTLNGVKVPVILCHADSCDLGLGSNHGDVLHWFKKYGKTMNDVRKDVAALMKSAGSVPTTPNTTTTPTTPTIPTTSQTNSINVNDVVKIAPNATYYSGKEIPSWVKGKNWIVKSASGDRVVIDKSADGKNAICSPINAKYLTVVNSTGSANNTNTTFNSYKVKVTTDALNIRNGAGTNYDKVGIIKDNGIYTIVDEATGKGATKWGLLKSYKDNRNGWISLDYCKKI